MFDLFQLFQYLVMELWGYEAMEQWSYGVWAMGITEILKYSVFI